MSVIGIHAYDELRGLGADLDGPSKPGPNCGVMESLPLVSLLSRFAPRGKACVGFAQPLFEFFVQPLCQFRKVCCEVALFANIIIQVV